jgi:hypothetical protein
MAITKTLLQRNHLGAIVKYVATAAADTTTLRLRNTITFTSPGTSLVFAPNANGYGGTITRQAGSWLTDGVLATDVRQTTGATGDLGNSVIMFAAGAPGTGVQNVANQGPFTIISATATVLTIHPSQRMIAETVSATPATPTGYNSDILLPGQFIIGGLSGTPKVNLADMNYSLNSATAVTVTRNSVVVVQLYGYNALPAYGMAENNTFDVVMTFTGGAGTVIMEYKKVDGFTAPSQMNDVQSTGQVNGNF